MTPNICSATWHTYYAKHADTALFCVSLVIKYFLFCCASVRCRGNQMHVAHFTRYVLPLFPASLARSQESWFRIQLRLCLNRSFMLNVHAKFYPGVWIKSDRHDFHWAQWKPCWSPGWHRFLTISLLRFIADSSLPIFEQSIFWLWERLMIGVWEGCNRNMNHAMFFSIIIIFSYYDTKEHHNMIGWTWSKYCF